MNVSWFASRLLCVASLHWILSFAASARITNCIVTGLDMLRGTNKIGKIKATFDLRTKIALYKVKFCHNHKKSYCFATKVDASIKLTEKDVIRNIHLWTKLIATIEGEVAVAMYNPLHHRDTYGGPNDNSSCTGKYYIITGEPSHHTIDKIEFKASTTLKPAACLDTSKCKRDCIHSTDDTRNCSKIRVSCEFMSCKNRTRKKYRKSKSRT